MKFEVCGTTYASDGLFELLSDHLNIYRTIVVKDGIRK